MAHAFYHSESSVRTFGGIVEDYLPIHEWIDGSKITYSDYRHRALRHHTFGVFECEERFGVTVTNNDGVEVPVRAIAEKHIMEDLGRIPSVQDWLQHIPGEFWMSGRSRNTAGV